MRNRWDITPQYLNQLISRIEIHAQNYEEYRGSLWLHKDENTPKLFAKIYEIREKISAIKAPAAPVQSEQIAAPDDVSKLTLKEIMANQPAADRTSFALYHEILHQLFTCYNQSEHQDHLCMRALYDLLRTELRTQSEANLQSPNEDCNEKACISQALQNLENHAAYHSTNEKLYAERWNIGNSLLQSLKKHVEATQTDLKWDQMREDQSWHIQRNDEHEINTAAKFILGLIGDHKADCFVLQKKNAEIREQEKQLRELHSKKNKLENHYKKELEKLRDRRKHHPDHATGIANQIRELEQNSRNEISCLDIEIECQTKEIHTALIALMLDTSKQDSGRNSLQRLQDLAHELSLWNTRNLSILLMDNLLDAQIRILKQMESIDRTANQQEEAKLYEIDDTQKTGLAKMIESLSGELQHILEHVSEAEERISAELAELKKIADARLVDMHHLEPFTMVRNKLSPKEEAHDFMQYAEQHLSELTTLQHFETAKALRTYQQSYRFGALLPRAKDVLEYQPPVVPAPAPSDDAIAPGSLRRSQRVPSGLSDITTLPTKPALTPASKPELLADNDNNDDSDDEQDNEKENRPLIAAASTSSSQVLPQQSSSLGKNILFGIAVGFSIALLVAGITAAVIFSGGTVLGAAALGFIFGGIFGAGIFGGAIGGSIYSCCNGSKTSQSASSASPQRTNNANVFSHVGGAKGFNVTEPEYAPLPGSPENDAAELAFTTGLQPSASPAFRSQGM